MIAVYKLDECSNVLCVVDRVTYRIVEIQYPLRKESIRSYLLILFSKSKSNNTNEPQQVVNVNHTSLDAVFNYVTLLLLTIVEITFSRLPFYELIRKRVLKQNPYVYETLKHALPS